MRIFGSKEWARCPICKAVIIMDNNDDGDTHVKYHESIQKLIVDASNGVKLEIVKGTL